MRNFEIGVIIALSSNRIESLFDRALKSVYKQQLPLKIKPKIRVIISCDDFNEAQKEKVKNKVKSIRDELCFSDNFPTQIIDNNRTKKHSGTGAWNSAAFHLLNASKNKKKCYLAFLDDDDCWDITYLQECLKVLYKHKNVGLIASGIYYRTRNETKILQANKKTLQKENVFLQNPYIQGSNLFISLRAFFAIGGFDESMPSTTDRDLIMRYLEYTEVCKKIQTKFINKPLVSHFADDDRERITTNSKAKHKGLALFYRKYLDDFSLTLQEKSLNRAKNIFGFKIHSSTHLDSYKNLEQQDNKHKTLTQQNSTKPLNLILAFACFDTKNIKELLESFVKITLSKQPNLSIKTCVLTSTKLETKMQEILSQYPFNFHLSIMDKKESIAISRTKLQHFVYKIGTKRYGNDFITWIVDDDLRFYGFDGEKTYGIDYLSHIAAYKDSGIDCLFGGVVGEPPLPFLSTLRVQLLDLFYTLKNQNNLTHKITQEKDYFGREYYYDLSSQDFAFLEYPFFSDMSPKDMIVKLQNGCIATRKLTMPKTKAGILQTDSIHRGGNSIIYNPLLLKLPNFTPNKKCYNRRSDFNWAIIHKELHCYTLKAVNLPLLHIRNSIALKIECEKIQSDLIGLVFYRIFQHLCVSYKQKNPLSYDEMQKLFKQELQNLKIKLYANMYRIETLDKLIYNKIHKRKYQQPYKKLSKKIQQSLKEFKKFCKQNQSLSYDHYIKCCDFIEKYLRHK
ncbi:glycosyltransferase family A protein [Helicobacter bilis]|uniref:glycosyltransferase family A protein n=1 Tax=Helicobacter bilis TaxID=37372 RepID=UPI00248ECE1B|nr:glycosyltransferase family A protein [Helicobacter bilis]